MPTEFVRFDEIEDVLSSLDLLALTTPLLIKHPSYWKWAIVAVHAGLQGAMVCALRDSSGVSVLTKDSAREMLMWFETQEGALPEEHLLDFGKLLKRCQQAKWMNGDPLQLTATQLKDVKRLHDQFRNNFAHFIPKGWSIEKRGLPRIISVALDAIEILMRHRRVANRVSENQTRRLAKRLDSIRKALRLRLLT
jgi:hypothetical protein